MKKLINSSQTKTEGLSSSLEKSVSEIQSLVQKLTITIMILVVAVVGILLKEFLPSLNKNQAANINNQAISPTPEEFPILTNYPKFGKDDFVRGNRDSKYVMITYTDLECPFCKRFHQSMLEFLKTNGDKVAWVFKNFPLDQIHSQARDEAIAAMCVGKLAGNDSFWKFVDKVFEVTPSNNGLNLVELPNYAGEAGVDVNAFNNCYSNKETKDVVNANQKEGAEFGVNGTPGSFLINTQTKKAVLIPGALPAQLLEQAFNKIK